MTVIYSLDWILSVEVLSANLAQAYSKLIQLVQFGLGLGHGPVVLFAQPLKIE